MALKSEVETLRRLLQDHAGFVESIRNAPDDEALSIVRRLRMTENVSAMLSSYGGRIGCTTQISEHASARAAIPSTESGIEFELVMLHPTAYPALTPLSSSSIASATLTREPALLSTIASSSNVSPLPLEPHTFCDPRLEYLSVKYWTRVPIDDRLAAQAVSHFVQVDHPVLGFFDADLFLRDLVEQRLNFCSSFLFSSVMSFACQSYGMIDQRTTLFAVAFMEEALKLWPAERSSDSTVTLAALNCLALATGWDGRSELGNHQLVADARAMATRMHRLDVPPTDELIAHFQQLHGDILRDRAHVAWGSYGWQSLRASFFAKPPIRYPPNLPIPGDNLDILAAPASSGSTNPSPTHLDHIFAALSKFWVIVQEIFAVYNMQDDAPLVERVIPAFAEAKYQKLLAWADTLHTELGNSKDSTAHAHIFHAIYHTTILNLFRPFLDPPNVIHLRSFSSADGTSRAVFSASVKQLKRLMYNYRTHVPRHMAQSSMFNAAVLHISSIVVKQAAIDPSWRFFFRLCFDYWKDVHVCYRVFAGVVPAHLSLALQCGAITVQEARLMNQEFQAAGRHHRVADEVLTDSYIDFEKAIRKEDGATMHELTERFKELMMFQDFTQEYAEV
ncbi:uncharacterized protein EKO05_0003682 [Ascochyta rabiei]|uniref:Sequence-specific DNA binding RNA polymerase II transcription factor n=1 Tax=Didymella rabiei TaxID=5454 RepID=A0A162YUM8_DIDRA|nr:uncharacterized protein EKO05_0003682 [Ascochyta rabiei]KZM20236.1 sequence-specific DNA binding RNA polymerase II transcription factor [Ascochyta rabiei]UPX13156.1 hypothetical protein EKO05_0003682 [Ascochyta rabiei]